MTRIENILNDSYSTLTRSAYDSDSIKSDSGTSLLYITIGKLTVECITLYLYTQHTNRR